MPAWRYILQDALTGDFLHTDLPLTTEGPLWELNGPGSLRGTINPQPLDSLKDEDGRPVVREWGTLIYAEADDQIRWGGIVQRSDWSGPQWTIEAAGFISYPHGMPYVGPVYAKVKHDPTVAVVDIWAYLQGQPDGDLNVQVIRPTDCPVRLGVPGVPGYREVQIGGKWRKQSEVDASLIQVAAESSLAASMKVTDKVLVLSTLGTRKYPLGVGGYGKLDPPYIVECGSEKMQVTKRQGLKLTVVRGYGSSTATAHSKGTGVDLADPTQFRDVEAVPAEPYALNWWEATDCGDEIAKLATETPFDYTEEHVWSGDQIVHWVILDYPRIGRKRDDLSFQQGVNVTKVVEATRNGDEFANAVLGVGKGEGIKSLRSESAVRDGRLRRVAVVTDKTAGTTSRLSSIVQKERGIRSLDVEIAQVTVQDHVDAPVGSWRVGDDVLIRAELPWLGEVSIWSRIISWRMQGDDTAVLNLKRSDHFRYGGS